MNVRERLPILTVTSIPHPCSYLPGRVARSEFAMSSRLSGATFERLLEQGFRRCSDMFYRPACSGCHECQAIRVLVPEFRPDRSQRRCWNANQDLTVRICRPRLTSAKLALYRRYLEIRHDRDAGDGPEDFLYNSPVESREIEFWMNDQLVCVAIIDLIPSGLSAVYTYFDPDHAARGLGTFAVLWEINYCRERDWPYCYLGYYVRDCRKMNYKNRYLPHEVLGADGTWHRSAP